MRAYVLIALWDVRPGLGGYTVADAITFCFLSQAFIGPMQMFGGGLGISDRIRTGDIAFDLVRPASMLVWNMADDLGRAAYLTILRSLPPTIIGAILFGLVAPAQPSFFVLSFVLAVTVSYAWRYLIALSACWIIDDKGVQTISSVLTMFFSGMILPLTLFPGWLGTAANASPFAAMVQVPADIYLGTRNPLSGLAFQVFWAAVLLAAGALLTRQARRKVVIQGG
ncbi:ABC transporter permease [Acrocarpospora corrugata]|uniref:ABC transporter permease n=1 Tax=Acrocarpospora corrugata TaxID=35763 RepID=A0A5M3W4W6_9ACTN|nr:ABC-2 family transporter protein [Acrocarpospora corrugata]GES04107.1 ABC transporter permease [Acrocarpospora corrugata]